MFKIASWNVNSLKIRLEQVLTWLESNPIDILAVQETKLLDENFPLDIFKEKGYDLVISGQKTYNGVAIISKSPILEVIKDIPNLVDPQRRILAASIGNLRVINLYVPNGAAVNSDKYHYKLDWLQKVSSFIKEQLKIYRKLIVLGDFNIAPEDKDVHDPQVWENQVMVSPAEREAFSVLLDLGLKDSFRLFSQEGNAYTWWDYRAGKFRRNHGLRIDHILLSNELSQDCITSEIDIEPRRSERPSDHAPIWIALNI
jgi:exodeoxyribonuclease-3